MQIKQLILAATTCLLLTACQNYKDCVRQVIASDLSSSEKSSLQKMCVFEYEYQLSSRQLSELDATALLTKKWGASSIYQFAPDVKNNTSSMSISEIQFIVSVKVKGEWQDFKLQKRLYLEPNEIRTLSFDESPDLIKLETDIEKGDWVFTIDSAKGVSLR